MRRSPDAPTAILEALCRALVDAGMPVSRATAGACLIHPLLDATLVIWRTDRGAYLDDTPRPAVRGNEAWRHSPFHRMEQEGSDCCGAGWSGATGATSSRCWPTSRPRGRPTIWSCARASLPASRWEPAPASSRPGSPAAPVASRRPSSIGSRASSRSSPWSSRQHWAPPTAGTLLATYLGADAAGGSSAATSSAARSR